MQLQSPHPSACACESGCTAVKTGTPGLRPHSHRRSPDQSTAHICAGLNAIQHTLERTNSHRKIGVDAGLLVLQPCCVVREDSTEVPEKARKARSLQGGVRRKPRQARHEQRPPNPIGRFGRSVRDVVTIHSARIVLGHACKPWPWQMQARRGRGARRRTHVGGLSRMNEATMITSPDTVCA